MDSTNKKTKGEQDMQLLVALVIKWPKQLLRKTKFLSP